MSERVKDNQPAAITCKCGAELARTTGAALVFDRVVIAQIVMLYCTDCKRARLWRPKNKAIVSAKVPVELSQVA